MGVRSFYSQAFQEYDELFCLIIGQALLGINYANLLDSVDRLYMVTGQLDQTLHSLPPG